MRVSLIVFLVSFFLAAFLLYQSQMEEYENQRNIRLCGSWILEQSGYVTTPEALHPYVKNSPVCIIRAYTSILTGLLQIHLFLFFLSHCTSVW